MRAREGTLTDAVEGKARQVRGAVDRADWRSTLARAGLVAKGVLYAVLGLLAILLAAGEASSQQASKRGALTLIASQAFGKWLLGLLTAGLFSLAIWQAIIAVRGDPVRGSDKKHRVEFAVKAVVYLSTAISGLLVLIGHMGGGSSGGGSSSGGSGSGAGGGGKEQATATVLGWPGGPWIVGFVGLVLIGVAVYQAHAHAVKLGFMERLDRSRMRSKMNSAVCAMGRAGYTARSIVLAIAGGFLITAAVRHDPDKAVGLSGALQALSGKPWGQIVLWIVAIGLFLYGIYCFAEARYRRAT